MQQTQTLCPVFNPSHSHMVSQEAIAAIGHVWTVLIRLDGTYMDVFLYHLSSLLF